MARLLRGYLGTGMENVALWHERDISHSSAERVVLPDACLVTYYILRRCTSLLDGLVVHGSRMRRNLEEGSRGLVFSQPALLALVASGMERDVAYRVVQRDARRAVEEERHLRAVLEEDDEVSLDASVMDEVFDLSRSLAQVHRFLDAIEGVETND
jgi:adenylosuccinate lyase